MEEMPNLLEHDDLRKQLQTITEAVARVAETIQQISLNMAVSERGREAQADDIVIIKQDLRELKIALYGERTTAGLVATVAKHEHDLARIERLVWLIIGSAVTIIVGALANSVMHFIK